MSSTRALSIYLSKMKYDDLLSLVVEKGKLAGPGRRRHLHWGLSSKLVPDLPRTGKGLGRWKGRGNPYWGWDQGVRAKLKKRSEFAHNQRNTIAHGVDRDLEGFDGTVGTFDNVVWEADDWAREVILRVLRLLKRLGNLDAVLDLLDEAENDNVAMATVGSSVERND